MSKGIQFTRSGRLKHLLTIEGLSKKHLLEILDLAETFFKTDNHKLSQVDTLKNSTVANLFFEPSTRTRSTFELAAKNLSGKVLNLNIQQSATTKGETLRDTVKNIEAMQCDILVIRHSTAGAADFVAKHVAPGVSVINAGDGWHAHPTQALLDMYTIRKHRGDINKLNIAIVGDIKHSRVARSQIHALHLMGAQNIRVIAPKTLLPSHPDALGVSVFHDLKTGLTDVDVIMMLRLQRERMKNGLLPKGNAYYRMYGLTEESLTYAHPNALIVHPGPINRGVEIQSDIADSPRAAILDQVTNGVAIRMAVMTLLKETQSA